MQVFGFLKLFTWAQPSVEKLYVYRLEEEMETNQKNAENVQHQLDCDIADLKVLLVPWIMYFTDCLATFIW